MEIAKKHAGNDFEAIADLTKRRVRDLADESSGLSFRTSLPADLHEAARQIQASVRNVSFRYELRLSRLTIKPSLCSTPTPQDWSVR